VAKQQVENGAQIIDITWTKACSIRCDVTSWNLIASEPTSRACHHGR